MSSSPEQWAPPDLRVGAPTTTAEPEFPIFEVGTSAGVPESLLAPARDAAHAAGYAAGWAHGMQMAEQRAAAAATQAHAELQQVVSEQRAGVARGLSALHAAADALEQLAVPGAEQLEALILGAAFGIAEALVGHALRDDATRAPAALARILALAPHGEPVTVRLHPADHAIVANHSSLDGDARQLSFVADPQLQLGDAVATSGATEIDARISSGLARIRDALGQ
jgi:flagellar assembly protein FliH